MIITVDDEDYGLTPLSATAAALSLLMTTKISALDVVFSI